MQADWCVDGGQQSMVQPALHHKAMSLVLQVADGMTLSRNSTLKTMTMFAKFVHSEETDSTIRVLSRPYVVNQVGHLKISLPSLWLSPPRRQACQTQEGRAVGLVSDQSLVCGQFDCCLHFLFVSPCLSWTRSERLRPLWNSSAWMDGWTRQFVC